MDKQHKLIKSASLFNILYTTIIGIVALYLFIKGYLLFVVPIPVWGVLCLLSFPFIVLHIYLFIIDKKKRIFKIGDAVNIVADNRKFIVVDYSIFCINRLKLKHENHDLVVMVNAKYLSSYKESSHSLYQSLGIMNNPSEQPAVKCTITKL